MARDFPRISRSQAATLLRWSDFVLRAGHGGPRLTLQDDQGGAMHLPLRVTSADQVTVAAPKLPFGGANKAAKVRALLRQSNLPDNDLWRALKDALGDQTQGILQRRDRGDLHFRNLHEAFIAYRDHGSDDAVREATARYVSMYVEASNVAEVREQAATLGSNVAHWFDGLLAPALVPTKIIDASFLHPVVPLKTGAFVTAGNPPLLHTRVDGVWTSKAIAGLPEDWDWGLALGDGFVMYARDTMQTWLEVDGVWKSTEITVEDGTSVAMILGNRFIALPHHKDTSGTATPVVDVFLRPDGSTKRPRWSLPVTRIRDARVFDDKSFIVSCEQGVQHIALGTDGGYATKLTCRISPWVRKAGEGACALSTDTGIEFWQRKAGAWSHTSVAVDKKVMRVWSHPQGLLSSHESETHLRLWQRQGDGWAWQSISIPCTNISNLWCVGDTFVVHDTNNHVQAWSPQAPIIDLTDGRPDVTNIEAALQAQRLQKVHALWQAGERPEEATVLAAACDADAPLACLARTMDVRSAAGDTLVGLALKQGKADSAKIHLLHGVRCDPADVDFALAAHPESSVVAALLARGILPVDDPRLLKLPAETTLWLVLQTFAMGFSATGLRLIERGFPIFPPMENAQIPAFTTGSARLFAALKNKPYRLTQALMQAPEALRMCSGVDMANLATALVGDACLRPLLRPLTALPGVPWHGSSWENQPQDERTLQLLRECGLPSFALARVAASRPPSDWSIPPLAMPRAAWLYAARPASAHRVWLHTERRAAEAGDAAACEDMVRYLTQPRSDWRGDLRIHLAGEPGIDEGGLLREWFAWAIKTLFNTERGAFVPAGQAAYLTLNSEKDDAERRRTRWSTIGRARYPWFTHPPPRVLTREDHCLAAGRLVGHCLVGGYPIGLRLVPTLVSLMTGRVPSAEMLREANFPYLEWLPRMLANANEETGLTFNAADGTPLIAHGARIDVTDSNKQDYVQALGAYMANSEAFLRGVFDVIPGSVLEKLSVQELSNLITGNLTIDKAYFLQNIEYNREESDPLVTTFKQVVHGYDETQMKRLLFLVTNLIAVPAEGYRPIHVEFKENLRVPKSHTCSFYLDMPITKDIETLREAMALFLTQEMAYGLG